MIKTTIVRSATLLAIAGAFGAQRISAQACDASTLSGAYGFSAAQSGTQAPATSTTPPAGTAPMPSGVYSPTPVGQLLAGVNGSGPFSATGRLFFDGAGNVSTASMPGAANALAGTYTVNPDCSVSMSLLDPFGSNRTVKTSLAGVISGRGSAVDLAPAPVSTAPATGDSGAATPTEPSAPTTSGVSIHLSRVFYASGCSLGNLVGAYAFSANGVATQPGSGSATPDVESARKALAATAVPVEAPGTTGLTVTGPLTLLGAMRFDGAGNIIPNPSYAQSPLSYLQATGSYTLNSDCTGTMTLTNGSAPMSASFVLVQPVSPGGPGSQSAADIALNIFSGTAVVTGTAHPQ